MLFLSYLFNLHNEKSTNEKTLERFENFKIGVKVICTMKYADGLVLPSKEEMVLQGMTERLI